MNSTSLTHCNKPLSSLRTKAQVDAAMKCAGMSISPSLKEHRKTLSTRVQALVDWTLVNLVDDSNKSLTDGEVHSLEGLVLSKKERDAKKLLVPDYKQPILAKQMSESVEPPQLQAHSATVHNTTSFQRPNDSPFNIQRNLEAIPSSSHSRFPLLGPLVSSTAFNPTLRLHFEVPSLPFALPDSLAKLSVHELRWLSRSASYPRQSLVPIQFISSVFKQYALSAGLVHVHNGCLYVSDIDFEAMTACSSEPSSTSPIQPSLFTPAAAEAATIAIFPASSASSSSFSSPTSSIGQILPPDVSMKSPYQTQKQQEKKSKYQEIEIATRNAPNVIPTHSTYFKMCKFHELPVDIQHRAYSLGYVFLKEGVAHVSEEGLRRCCKVGSGRK
ncbi:hypothetical protein BDR26DRAFT_871702 [Obelidium mucronatum]|nr:hypothetical protein BDR26DRAFT_871702 [Obelidium mucronatum]